MACTRRFTILGCGSSPGVPRINSDWGNCDPANPKNRRTRTAAMFERIGPGGITRVAIDTGPDFREQMIAAGVTHLDAVAYTHAHADHIHGIDDLRGYFGYCFETPPGSSYPPIVEPYEIEPYRRFSVTGAGGTIELDPLQQEHGDIVSLGFRVAGIAYCPDVSGFPAATLDRLKGLDLLVVDALQYNRHPSHFSLEQALEYIESLAPARAVLTHMHTPLDYDAVMRETPDHVEPGFDGLTIEFEV